MEVNNIIFTDDVEPEDPTLLDDENLSKTIVDISVSLETRIKAINRYAEVQGNDNTIETINKLGMMYQLSNTRTLRQYLYTICEKSSLNAFLKSISAKTLCVQDEKDDLGYKAVSTVYPLMGEDVGTPYKIDFVKLLMKNEKYKDNANTYFCSIINNDKLNCDYRYKVILGLESENKDLFSFFIKEACLTFLKNNKNILSYRILSAQNLLQKKHEKDFVQDILFGIANDESVEYNTRADATDVLLQLGDDEAKKVARDIIIKLGGQKYTIYSNAQNVHSKAVEDSVKDALTFLQSFEIMKVKSKVIDMNYVEEQILALDNGQNIKVALNRIRMDRALYSEYNCTLVHILLQVWTYLSKHKSETEMKVRLLEELNEMAGTCSSGYATRLINTISGFGDFSMRISWRDQIISNLSGRLNAKIREMDDLDLQEKVLEEMTIESCNYEKRKHFLRFFRENVIDIMEEMYHEFKELVTDTDFDLYFRQAVSAYETGEFSQ
jgi:hypothetical protein